MIVRVEVPGFAIELECQALPSTAGEYMLRSTKLGCEVTLLLEPRDLETWELQEEPEESVRARNPLRTDS